jgi:hypothetical protein
MKVSVKRNAQGEIESVSRMVAGNIYNSNEGPASKKRGSRNKTDGKRRRDGGVRGVRGAQTLLLLVSSVTIP